MWLKASYKEIQFDLTVAENIQDIAKNQLPAGKLSTLLADLIENAIIAVSNVAHKKISVEMGIIDDCFEISIQDSGIPFEIETLANLGFKKSTTHADTGGSGIGYMTIFEILNESGASLSITEYAPEIYAFTKSIKIRFDGNSEYTISSFRANEIGLSEKRATYPILPHSI